MAHLVHRRHGMARALRIEFPGAFYHVTSRGNERKPIYRDDADRRRALAIVADVVARFHLLLHAYVLMDNHYHLLLETLEANLARAMRALNGDYAKQFNRVHGRVGHLFARRYQAILVDRDTYLVELSRYIHRNPVRAGLAERAEDYHWSSAPAYVGDAAASRCLTMADLLGHFGGRLGQAQRRYRAFLCHSDEAPPSGSPLRAAVAGTLLGPPAWVQQMRGRLDPWLAARHAGQVHAEIPAVSRLRLRPALDEVVDAVGAAMHVERQAITHRHSRHPARAVALYLTAHLSGLSQQEIGAAFGIGRFAVSKAAARIERARAGDRPLDDLIRHLRTALRGDRH